MIVCLAAAALVGAAFATPLAAEPLRQDCLPYLALAARTASPRLWRVNGSGGVRFIASRMKRAGCPNLSPSCRLLDQAEPGSLVVATSLTGPFACVVAVGPAPTLRAAQGWLPLTRLRPVDTGHRTRAGWVGDWLAGPEQRLSIRVSGRRALSVHGTATWGAEDPARAAEGRVNIGEMTARGAPRGDRLDLAADGADSCAARMWRLGPYLIVADNRRCGGANVSFAGIYRLAG
ncbi:MAG TPA: hypothetical protein VIB82_10115 [Caulobacteraceae bacterium]|jgi:hypothetical protein